MIGEADGVKKSLHDKKHEDRSIKKKKRRKALLIILGLIMIWGMINLCITLIFSSMIPHRYASDAEIARKLGRSVASIQKRRWFLKKLYTEGESPWN